MSYCTTLFSLNRYNRPTLLNPRTFLLIFPNFFPHFFHCLPYSFPLFIIRLDKLLIRVPTFGCTIKRGHIHMSIQVTPHSWLRSISVPPTMSDLHGSLLKARVKMISSLYNYTNRVAESRQGSNRGIAAGTAASLLGMSLDHFERAEEGSPSLTEAEIEQLGRMALSATEHNQAKDHGHFMDRFMEKLLQHTIAEDSEGLAELQSRAADPARNNQPQLSIRILTSNLKKLSAQMKPLFRVQYGAIHIITWRKPTKTLSALVMYTALCCWPHLVVAFPLLFLLVGVIIPANLYRHPLVRPDFLPVKRRGQSLLEFLNHSEDHSVFLDIFNDDHDLLLEDGLSWSSKSTDSYGPTSVLTSSNIDTPEELGKSDKSKYVKAQVSLLMNMRDLQNLTSDVIEGMERANQVSLDMLSFKDERLTTFIFYALIGTTFFVLAFGKYIPWRLIFILFGWVAIALCHPNTNKYLLKLKTAPSMEKEDKESEPLDHDSAKITGPKPSFLETFDSRNIIVDDEPEARVVEIYELQVRNVLSHTWDHHAYSKRLFDYKDKVRIAGKLPHGVDNLSKVLPPPEWKYDIGSAKSWRIDVDPAHFLRTRGIDQQRLTIRSDEEDGWIYDKIPLEDDSATEFRRRRLFRECFRYARPVHPVCVV